MNSARRNLFFGAAVGAALGLGILLLLILGLWPAPRPLSPPALPEPSAVGALSGVTVVLDPGHGGADPGTVVGPLSEAALTYRTAAETAAALRREGASVVYTVRSRQLDPEVALIEPPIELPIDAVMALTGSPLRLRHSPQPLWQRAATARVVWNRRVQAGPDARRDVFFLSLHYDQFGSEDVSGATVCVDRRVRQIPVLAKALAAQMADGGFGRRSDFRGISGIAGRQLGVLNPRYNPVPEKALLELATLSSPQDAFEAGSVEWRTEIARRITAAISEAHQQSPAPPSAR